mmetsp:Transcript_13738/g.9904  ORF Transcript_13738/g.9904 Transcript_13738/m.9904 type:complete len:169 (-) Transcript_13738:92-598(-)
MAEGKLVPDEIIIKLIQEEIKEESSSTPILLDGFPRTLEQAKQLNKSFEVDVAIRLDVPHQIIMDRMAQRWIHFPSGRTYSYDYKPPKKIGFDDVTGEPLSQREDDKPEVVKRRLEQYDQLISPLMEFYESNPLCRVRTFTGTESNVIYKGLFEFLAREVFPVKYSKK